jgi:erythrin-vacuolar iron transport family protein
LKRFADLSEQEVLALAVSNEDEDNRIYRSFADGLRGSYADTAAMYDKMADEEIGHRDMLLELYRRKFGEFLPLVRRQDVKGFLKRRPLWLNRPLGLDAVRKFAEEMEYAARAPGSSFAPSSRASASCLSSAAASLRKRSRTASSSAELAARR